MPLCTEDISGFPFSRASLLDGPDYEPWKSQQHTDVPMTPTNSNTFNMRQRIRQLDLLVNACTLEMPQKLPSSSNNFHSEK